MTTKKRELKARVPSRAAPGSEASNYSGASLARKPAVRSGGGGVPLPLKWKNHHVKDNRWYGVTATGYEACYVYQPWDNRIRRGPMPWQVFSYFGGKDHPLTGTARFGKFPNASSAKRAAQKWWRGKMLAMLSGGGGAEHGERKRRTKSRAKPLNVQVERQSPCDGASTSEGT